MKQEENRWFNLVFIFVIVVYILIYILDKTSNPLPASHVDLEYYATALVSVQNPEMYIQDPIFGAGIFTRMIWSSSYLYMRLFQALHTLTGSNISQVLALLHLIPSVASVLTFYWCLRAFRMDRWVTLLMALGLSLWLLLLRYGDAGVPSLYYHACVPIFLRLLWEHLLEPSLLKKHVILWRVVLIGFLIAISSALINSTNALAFSLLTLVLTSFQWLLGRMKWQSYVVLLIGLVPTLLILSLGGTGGARVLLTDTSAASLVSTLPLADFLTPDSYFQFYTFIFLVVVLSGLLRWFRPSRITKFMFVFTSWLFWVLPLGNATILFFTYFVIRLIHKRDDWLDDALIIALNASVFVGPVLLTIFMGIWSVTHIHLLVFIMWQMFRFHAFGYFIGGIVFLRMTVYLTENISQVWLQRVAQAGIVLLIIRVSYFKTVSDYYLIAAVLLIVTLSLTSRSATLFQLRTFSNLAKGIGGVVLIVAVTFVTYILSRQGEFNGFAIATLLTTLGLYCFILISSARRLKGWVITGVLLLCMWIVSLAGLNGTLTGIYDTDQIPYVSLSEQQVETYYQNIATSKQSNADFVEMTYWLREHTPVDSLVHWHQTKDLNGFFRYLSQRSVLFSRMDVVVGQYNPDSYELSTRISLSVKTGDPQTMLWRIAQYNVGYVVFPSSVPILYPVLYRDSLILPRLIHKNSTYDVYKIETVPLLRVIQELRMRFAGLFMNMNQ